MSEADESKIFAYQNEFINWLTALNEIQGANSSIGTFVTPNVVHRLETYQSSYLGRVTTNLAQTLFEPCENLFGKEYVFHILASFFKAHPPRSDALTAAADALPQFVREHQSRREDLLFADLAEICIHRWKILIEIDFEPRLPQTDTPLEEVFLKQNSVFLEPSGTLDLAEVWLWAQEKRSTHIPLEFFEKSSGVLLSKDTALDFLVVGVPEQLMPFARALTLRQSIQDAIEVLDEALDENSDDSQVSLTLRDFLHVLSSLKMLEIKRGEGTL